MKHFVSLCTILYQIKCFKPGLSRHWHSLAEDAAWQWASIPAAGCQGTLCSTRSLWFMLQTPGHQSLWWDGHGTFCHSQQIHRGTQPATNLTVLLRVGWWVVVVTERQRHFCCSLRSQWGKTSVTHSLGWSESAICLWITEVFLSCLLPTLAVCANLFSFSCACSEPKRQAFVAWEWVKHEIWPFASPV